MPRTKPDPDGYYCEWCPQEAHTKHCGRWFCVDCAPVYRRLRNRHQTRRIAYKFRKAGKILPSCREEAKELKAEETRRIEEHDIEMPLPMGRATYGV